MIIHATYSDDGNEVFRQKGLQLRARPEARTQRYGAHNRPNSSMNEGDKNVGDYQFPEKVSVSAGIAKLARKQS